MLGRMAVDGPVSSGRCVVIIEVKMLPDLLRVVDPARCFEPTAVRREML